MTAPADNPEIKEQWVSDRFVDFVDIVFGVVVAEGFVRYSPLILSPGESIFQFLALLGVYVTTTLSWIGFHRSMHRYPYDTRSTRSWVRMGIDFLIVSLYARLLFSIADLSSTAEAADLSNILLGYFLIFVFYVFSGLSRVWEYNADWKASRLSGLLWSAAIYLVLYIFYRFVMGLLPCRSALNWVLVSVCPLFCVGYRVWRHRFYAPVDRR